MRLYAVTRPDYPEDQQTVIVRAYGREQAKRIAKEDLEYDPDNYIVEPLPGRDGRATIVWREHNAQRKN